MVMELGAGDQMRWLICRRLLVVVLGSLANCQSQSRSQSGYGPAGLGQVAGCARNTAGQVGCLP